MNDSNHDDNTVNPTDATHNEVQAELDRITKDLELAQHNYSRRGISNADKVFWGREMAKLVADLRQVKIKLRFASEPTTNKVQ